MKPESAAYLASARRCLEIAAGTMRWPEIAGRECYFAAFRAAQSVLFEREGTVAKTHRELRRRFARLARDEPRIDADLTGFLARGYDLKETADYKIGRDGVVPVERAQQAFVAARRFVDCVAALLEEEVA